MHIPGLLGRRRQRESLVQQRPLKGAVERHQRLAGLESIAILDRDPVDLGGEFRRQGRMPGCDQLRRNRRFRGLGEGHRRDTKPTTRRPRPIVASKDHQPIGRTAIDRVAKRRRFMRCFRTGPPCDSRKEENSSNNNFPRTCENEVPANVKQAQMLEAYEIATGKDKDVQAINKGIKSRGISDMSYSYEKALKVGDTTFSNIQAAKIMQMYERKTFGQRINNGY